MDCGFEIAQDRVSQSRRLQSADRAVQDKWRGSHICYEYNVSFAVKMEESNKGARRNDLVI